MIVAKVNLVYLLLGWLNLAPLVDHKSQKASDDLCMTVANSNSSSFLDNIELFITS